MQTLQSDSLPGYTSLGRSCTLTKFILATCSSKLQQLVTCPVIIVREKKYVRTWTITSSGKLSTKLVNTELEALASTCLGSRSYMKGSLKLAPISNGGIRITLSYLPQMGQKLMTQSTVSYLAGLTKCFGRGGKRQDLQEPPY